MTVQSTVTGAANTPYSTYRPSFRSRLEALRHCRWVAAGVEVDVGPVALGEVADHGLGVVGADVDRDVGAAFGREVEFRRDVVQCDHVGRALGSRTGDHAQSDRAATGDDDDVAELDSCPLDGVQRAGQRFGERGMRAGNVGGHLVHDGVGRDISCTPPLLR